MTAPLPNDPTNPKTWLASYARVQVVADRELLRVLRKALTDITRMILEISRRPGTGSAVRVAQLLHIKRQLLREQAEIFRKLGDIISARRVDAAAAAIRMSGALDSVLFGAAGRTAEAIAVERSALLGLTSTVEVAVVRMTQSAFPLARRIYNTQTWMAGRLDRMVNSALLRGLSPAEFAREARDWFSPDTPGGVRYAAMRLARTEINNAFHAMSVNSSVGKPWVTGMKWNLSGSHPRSDDCDALAGDDSFNLGDGVFPALEVPRKPHPQCFCFVVPVTVDEDEFLDNLVGGKYDDWLNTHGASPLGEGRALTLLPAQPPVPVKPVPKPKPAKPTKTPEQIAAAKLRTRATAHATRLGKNIPEGTAGQRTTVVSELKQQANKTPASLVKLQSIHGDHGATQYGKNFVSSQGRNTGAFYRYTGPLREIHLSPQIYDDPANFHHAFSSGQGDKSGEWHAPTSRGGLASTVAHEYGHHLDSMITDHSGHWPKAKADRFFPILARELGIVDHPQRSTTWLHGDGVVKFEDFDLWVAKHKRHIQRHVSKYAATNGREIIAEIWSEYTTAKKPRGYISNIGKILQELAEEASL